MDISIEVGDSMLNYRAAAVIRNGGKVLVHHSKRKDHVTLIGGRVAVGEDSISAITREVKEEIGLSTKYVRPVAYIENFFKLNDKNYHEILLIHELEFKDNNMYKKESFEAIEPHKKDILEFLWYDLENNNNTLKFIPKKLFGILKENNGEFIHVINNEINKN